MADQNVLLNTITNSHNFNFTNIVLPSKIWAGSSWEVLCRLLLDTGLVCSRSVSKNAREGTTTQKEQTARTRTEQKTQQKMQK